MPARSGSKGRLVRAFPTWLQLSSFVRVERIATTAAAR
jgi:hypothetical protein